MRRRIPLAPAEGWVTLGLVLLICLTMAWALDDARWVLGQAKYLDYLVVAAIGGVLVGFIGPKVGWGRWLTYLIGSIFAALIVPLITTLAALPAGESVPSIYNLFQATSDSVVNAYLDIAYRGLPSTIEYLHFIYAFGLLVWATSMFASYAVFGHRRPMNAVIVVGVVLVANMAITLNDELWFLVLYSLASLFLLIRSHVFDEQSEWLRRRIGDPSSISSVYLRGGTIFIGVAVAGSVLLTQTASSAPLAGAFDGAQDSLIDISRAVSRFLPVGGQTRAIGMTFGDSTQVSTVWNTDGSTALVIHRDPTDKGSYYWRARTFDQIGLKGWSASMPTTVDRPAGSSILDKLPEDPDPTGLHPFTFTVQPDGFHGSTIFSPGTPTEVQEDSHLTTVGPGYFTGLDRDSGGTASYTVTALTQVGGEKPGELNDALLEAAGTDYPQSITDLYLGVADGQIGDNAQKLVERVKAEAISQAPFDLAQAMVKDLQNPANFHLRDQRPGPRLRGDLDGRVLRDVQEGLLPVLRTDDGRPPARDGDPDADGRGLPAGRGRPAHRHRDRPVQQRPRVGRGLLPGYRLGHVRPDRRRPVAGRPAAVGEADRQRADVDPGPAGRIAQDLRRPDRSTRWRGRADLRRSAAVRSGLSSRSALCF